MSDTMTTDTIPQVWQDEGASFYWCEGHVEPGLFVLACIMDTRINCGIEDMLAFMGAPDDTAAHVRDVQHCWFRPSPDDDEMLLPCESTDDDAYAFTKLSL